MGIIAFGRLSELGDRLRQEPRLIDSSISCSGYIKGGKKRLERLREKRRRSKGKRKGEVPSKASISFQGMLLLISNFSLYLLLAFFCRCFLLIVLFQFSLLLVGE